MPYVYSGYRPMCLACLALACGPAGAAPSSPGLVQYFQCPALIPAETVHIAGAPAGWAQFVPFNLHLRRVAISSGTAPGQADVAPSLIEQRKNSAIERWKFDDPHQARWLKCSYGLGGELTLSKQLGSNTYECTVRYAETDVHGVSDVYIRCLVLR